ncbi:Crp/Fnr family transcriptional regulator [Belliella marina]|uniref:Crp/Fnr family transcriptional regulator n=1 Tax=Belliella marina TaxID=1644146 RepID=A0ABW4VIM4_9BACT
MPEKLKINLVLDSIYEFGSEIDQIHLNPEKEISEGLVYVQEGIAKIYGINEKGLKINTDLIFQGEIFTVQNGNYQSRDNFYLEGLKFSKVIFLPSKYLSSIQRGILPEIQVKFYNERLKRIHQQKVRNYDLELHERIFYLLFDFCMIFGTDSGDYYTMPNYFTHDELSNILRNCRQNITACLNDLKREGIILYNRKEIKIEKSIFEEKKVKYLSGLRKNKKSATC